MLWRDPARICVGMCACAACEQHSQSAVPEGVLAHARQLAALTNRVARYVRTMGLRRTVRILYGYAARRVQYVLYAQVKRCGCRPWCCGFRNTALAPHGVDFTPLIGHLRNKCVPRRTNAFVSVFSGMDLMCTCAKKASQGRHKEEDIISLKWREDEED
eukprot:366090-Chlamydomonas_euryale.AAC.1